MSELRPAIEEYLRTVKDDKLRARLRDLAARYPDATIMELYAMAGRV